MEFSEDILAALSVLRNGGVILYPTDTIWGIGCNACDESAVKRVYTIKKRRDTKSMLVLLDSPGLLTQYVKEIPDIAWQLIEVSDDPLTLVYPGAKNLADSLISDDGSIGIRICSDPFCRELIRKLRKPMVSTSANISGQLSPSVFYEINQSIVSSVDYVVKWRQEDYTKRRPSSVIKLGAGGLFSIIRR